MIEAKRLWSRPGDGLQQAIRYAAMLNAPFALSTNGTGWALHNLITGLTSPVAELPTPVEAWDLYSSAHGLGDEAQALLLSRFSDHHTVSGCRRSRHLSHDHADPHRARSRRGANHADQFTEAASDALGRELTDMNTLSARADDFGAEAALRIERALSSYGGIAGDGAG